MTAVAASSSAVIPPERTQLRNVRVLAMKELRDSLRDRWLWFYTAAFAVLATALTSLATSEAENIGFEGFGRTASSLVALSQLVVPLMGLSIGARSIAGQRERGTMAFLLAYPVNATEVFLGIYLGSTAAILAAVSGGFGVAGLVAAARGNAVDGTDLVTIAGLAWLLSIAMIGTGMMVSVFTRRSSTATGLGLVLWLVFVLLGNLGLMGTSVATRVSDQVLFLAAVANPVEAFRLAAITTLGGSLDALGPVGTYAIDTFADATRLVTVASLVVWAVVPVAVGAFFFRRRPDQ
jgi:Cu-processing system permease protein